MKLALISLVLGPLVALSVAACGSSTNRASGYDDGTSSQIAPTDPGSIGSGTATPDPKAEECQKMDIVFVVDDSGSMAEEQTNLATNFPKFVEVLESYKTKSGSKLDYRLAVTTTGRDVTYNIDFAGTSFPTTEKGDNGAFRMSNACGTKQRWVETGDSKISSEFSCLAKVGTDGPSVEMPLESLKLALNDRVKDGTNAGFLRPDALLAFVVMTDEDDCSRSDDNFTLTGAEECDTMPNTVPLADYKSMLDNVAGGEGRWATAVIAGDKQCSSSFGDALEAKRLKKFVNLAGSKGTFSSICDGDLTGSLKQALDTFDAACRSFPPVR